MMDLSTTSDAVVKISPYCGDCGYPISSQSCPECGGVPMPRLLLIERRRKLGRIFGLLAFSWGAEVVMLGLLFVPMIVTSLTPALAGYTRFSIGAMQILYSATSVCTALAALTLAKGPWPLSQRMRTGLRIAAAGFMVNAFRRLLAVFMLMVPVDPFFMVYQWTEWPTWILTALALVMLFRGLGICSQFDPGRQERPFLKNAWIIIAAITSFTIFNWATRWLSSNQSVEQASQAIGLILVVIQTMIMAACVGFMVPWKRILTKCGDLQDGIEA